MKISYLIEIENNEMKRKILIKKEGKITLKTTK